MTQTLPVDKHRGRAATDRQTDRQTDTHTNQNWPDLLQPRQAEANKRLSCCWV